MAGQLTAYVDVDDVLDQLSDDDLLEELKDRNLALGKSALDTDDLELIEHLAREGRAYDLLTVVQGCFGLNRSPCKPTPYASLERDPVSGRPVIQ